MAGDDLAAACSDAGQLAALASYRIVDTPREAEFDDVAALAAQICAAPIALISFVLADRQWFKAELGLGVRETPLDSSICRHLLLTPGLTVIPDTRADPRTAGNPLVTAEPGLRFYAGCLLASARGRAAGHPVRAGSSAASGVGAGPAIRAADAGTAGRQPAGAAARRAREAGADRAEGSAARRAQPSGREQPAAHRGRDPPPIAARSRTRRRGRSCRRRAGAC